MKLSFFGKSDVGKVRQSNEDYFTNEMINEKEYLFIIADGMGGHQAGEVASKLGTTTFVKEYKKLRNKEKTIKDAMTLSLKKANSVILKRAISDPQKRGMGTTFTGCVISNKKATIIHVGDSRIYLIRENKIKKITTDHTFVEKMLTEGKITEEEAKDHPQKNILYMSLGARETYVPEIISNLDVKSGDIITMCSDGLNNMVEDRVIKEYSLAYDPEKSVKELIKLANDNGGIDNITVQIIHAGKVINKYKTQPLKKIKTKRKRIALSLSIGFSILILSIWFGWNGKYSKPIQENQSGLKTSYTYSSLFLKNKFFPPIKKNIQKIEPFLAEKKILSPQYFLSLGRDRLLIKKKHILYLYDISRSNLIQKKFLKPEEQIIPTNLYFSPSPEKSNFVLLKESKKKEINLDSYYIMKKVKSEYLKFNIVPLSRNKKILTIQSDKELNSINHESRTVKFTNMTPPITPLYIDTRAFIFNDKNNFFVIENPISAIKGELVFYKISNLKNHGEVTLSLKSSETEFKIIHFDNLTKNLKVFDITESKLIFSQEILFHFPEKPISVEYLDHNTVIFYFSNQYSILKNGSQVHQMPYYFNDEELLIQNIVLDSIDNQRILSDINNRIFKLNLTQND
jgi:protein phosphatase